MPDSRNHDFPLLVVHVIDNPIVANPDSIGSIAEFLGVGTARIFANLFKFLDDPLTKYFLRAGEFFVRAGNNQNFVGFHDVLNVHEIHDVINGKIFGSEGTG